MQPFPAPVPALDAAGATAPAPVAPTPAGDPSLSFRLRPPAPLRRGIDRRHLRSILARSRDQRLVAVCAPAGFGKTTVMQQYFDELAQEDATTLRLWMTLDDADNDVDRFVLELRAAWQALGVDAPRRAVDAAGDPALDSVFRQLAEVKQRLVMFLDEFESLRNPVVIELVNGLLLQLPAGAQLVIGSREQPRLSMAALRSAGQLLELGAAHLRLTLQESQTLVRRYPRPLSDRTITRLHERTEGWITAMQLAAHTVQQHPEPEAFAAAFSGSDSAVADYLLECVIGSLPATLREFTLLIGLLDEFDAEMGVAVTGMPNAGELLHELLRLNLFLTAMDEQRSRFRFHALFASFIRAEANRRHPSRVREVHRLASQWWAARKRAVPALHHALAAGDLPVALELLQVHAERLLLQGRFRLIARWYDTLQEHIRSSHPALIPVCACALALTRRQAEALEMLNAVAATLDEAHPQAAGVDRSWLGAVHGLTHAMLDQAEQCLDVSLRHHRPEGQPGASAAHGMLANALANALITATRFDEAMVVLTTAKQWHGNSHSRFNMNIAECVHATLELVQGRPRDAHTRLQAVLCERPGLDARALGGAAALWVGSGSALYALDRVSEARERLLEALPFTRDAGPPDILLLNHLLLSRCAYSVGDRESADQRLAEMERLGHATGLPRLVATAWLERARLALLDGQSALASDYLQHCELYPDVWAALRRFPASANDVLDLDLMRWRLEVQSGAAAAAIEPLRGAIKGADNQRRRVRAAVLRLVLAVAQQATGDTRMALRHVRDVVEWCELTGHARLLLDEGPALLPLVQALGSGRVQDASDGEPRLISRYLQVYRSAATPSSSSLVGEMPAWTALTERELDVLRQLDQGLSNKQIAEQMFISENTVKAHLRALNAKMGASNRTQAVSNARRFGLL